MKRNSETGSARLTKLIPNVPFYPALEAPVEEESVQPPESHEEWTTGKVNNPAVRGKTFYALGIRCPPVNRE